VESIDLVLILHNHQPVGNFDVVFEQAYQKAYAPFLEVLATHPGVRLGLHTSGPLLEWLEEHRPEYVARLRECVAAGQIEIVGGAYYEPILSMLPQRDRVGQIRAYTAHLTDLFPGRVRGMWLAERVWEQALTADLVEAGIECTALDDFHFKAAGLREHELLGYYLTEDQGRLLRVFPGSERLRYLIPFGTVEETIEYLRTTAKTASSADSRVARRKMGSDPRGQPPFSAPLLAYADDGEKFGLWPQTFKHVYTNGWLERFFTALEANAAWIRLLTPSECLDRVRPIGTLYLPDCSYREMTEWVLPTERLAEYERALARLKDDAQLSALRPFMRGGVWRNFKFKYTEAMWMYGRALQVSDALAAAGPAGDLSAARQALYRAQCNCPYWHGVFGGLYLPHLREATYSNLIAAQSAIDRSTHGTGPWVVTRRRDVDLDGAEEVELVNPHLAAVLKPSRGGRLVELDLARWRTNVLSTLTRRREAYHRTLEEAVAKGAVILAADAEKAKGDQVHSIHDITRVKEFGLEQRLIGDRFERESLIDHCFAPGTTLAQVAQGTYGELGSFAAGWYECADEEACVSMRCVGRLAGAEPRALHLDKSVSLRADAPGLTIDYMLRNPTAWPLDLLFGVELNFGMLAGQASDRYYRVGRDVLGNFSLERELADVVHLELVDEWRDLCVRLTSDQSAAVWLYPVETVSLSEAGFERVYQASCVIPHWAVSLAPEGAWRVRLTLAAVAARS
jgi:alpha-amylase/alpha-mannosidase (GH57 family)